jgi:hypothetical protein
MILRCVVQPHVTAWELVSLMNFYIHQLAAGLEDLNVDSAAQWDNKVKITGYLFTCNSWFCDSLLLVVEISPLLTGNLLRNGILYLQHHIGLCQT